MKNLLLLGTMSDQHYLRAPTGSRGLAHVIGGLPSSTREWWMRSGSRPRHGGQMKHRSLSAIIRTPSFYTDRSRDIAAAGLLKLSEVHQYRTYGCSNGCFIMTGILPDEKVAERVRLCHHCKCFCVFRKSETSTRGVFVKN